MFAKKWQSCYRPGKGFQSFKLLQFQNILEADVLQRQLERGILEGSAAVFGNDNILYFVSKLEKRFKKNVVLMIMCDEHIVDVIRKIAVSISRQLGLIRVADDWIEQHFHARCLNQNAGMPEISPPGALPGIRRVGFWRLRSEE